MSKEKENAIAAVRKLQIKLDVVSKFLTLPEMEMKEFLQILLNCKTILDTIVIDNQPLANMDSIDWFDSMTMDKPRNQYQDTIDMVSDMQRDLRNQIKDHERGLYKLNKHNSLILGVKPLDATEDIKSSSDIGVVYHKEKEDSLVDNTVDAPKEYSNSTDPGLFDKNGKKITLGDVYNVLKNVNDTLPNVGLNDFDDELLREENLPALDMRGWDKEAILNQVRNDLDSYIRTRKGLNRATLAERLGLSYPMFISLMNSHIANGFTLTEIKIIGDILGVIYIINNKEISTKLRMSRVPKG